MALGIFPTPLGGVGAADILRLIENGVGESRTLEYKQELPPITDAGKKEFLRDAAAFANASGGLLVYGVATRRAANSDTGVPERIVGLANLNFDDTVRRFGDTLRTGLQPGLSWAEWHHVPMPDSPGPVVLLRIPPAVVGPHMVSFQGAREFWRRGPAGRYQPDVQELRQMFLTGVTWLDQVEQFRRQRVELVRAGGAYPDLDLSSSVFVHVLPIGRLDGLVDLRPHEASLREFPPLTHMGWDPRFNAFGFMTFTGPKPVTSYTQWFRHGGIEAYSSAYRFQTPKTFGPQLEGLNARGLSADLLEFIRKALDRLQAVLGLDPPFAVGLATFGFVGSTIYSGHRGGRPVETDVGLLPAIIVDDPAATRLDEQLFLLLDVVWQSGG